MSVRVDGSGDVTVSIIGEADGLSGISRRLERCFRLKAPVCNFERFRPCEDSHEECLGESVFKVY